MSNLLIGIDPDCEKSGVAIKHLFEKVLDLKSLNFFDLIDFLEKKKDEIKEVRVEASWLISFNYTSKFANNKAIATKISNKVGENHYVGKLIVEKCKLLGIPVKEVRPLRKVWKGTNGKISKVEFVALTNWKGPANQEERDAYLLIH